MAGSPDGQLHAGDRRQRNRQGNPCHGRVAGHGAEGYRSDVYRWRAHQMGSFMPEIDVKETDKEIRVTAELPGMEQKDIEVTFIDGGLTIKGEKREEQEEEKGDWYHSERRWGAFERMIPLPADIDLNKAKAWFKKGVLKVTLPKSEQARSNRKTIPVEG